MKETGIIFTGELIPKILDGSKTHTRRIMKPQPEKILQGDWSELCPYGKAGDLLWVREAYWNKGYWETDKNFKKHWIIWPQPEEKVDFYYDADGEPDNIRGSYNPWGSPIYLRKHPSIHMKKEDSRIWLEITGIRVERVQDITTEDCIAEGYQGQRTDAAEKVADWWINLWDSINAKPKKSKHNPYTNAREDCYVGYPWEVVRTEKKLQSGLMEYIVGNPFVWPIEFKRIQKGK